MESRTFSQSRASSGRMSCVPRGRWKDLGFSLVLVINVATKYETLRICKTVFAVSYAFVCRSHEYAHRIQRHRRYNQLRISENTKPAGGPGAEDCAAGDEPAIKRPPIPRIRTRGAIIAEDGILARSERNRACGPMGGIRREGGLIEPEAVGGVLIRDIDAILPGLNRLARKRNDALDEILRAVHRADEPHRGSAPPRNRLAGKRVAEDHHLAALRPPGEKREFVNDEIFAGPGIRHHRGAADDE